MSAESSLHEARGSLEQADELLHCFYGQWDPADTRPLLVLKDALEAQQRALASLLLVVEHEQKCRRVLTGRVNGVTA